MTSRQPILTVHNLNVALQGAREILSDINFALPPGSTTAIIGESGCGKTTLCKALLGLLGRKFLINGNIELGNADGTIAVIDPGKLSAFTAVRGRRIGLLFQETPLTLNPVLRIGRQISDLTADSDRRAALQLLELVGFPEAAQIYMAFPHELSGGQAQRVGLALALAGRPDILIVDEPATALDTIARRDFFDLLRKIQIESGLTILMVTHDLHILTVAADRLIVMFAGRIVEQGDCKSVLEQPGHPYTRSLLQTDRAFRNGRWP